MSHRQEINLILKQVEPWPPEEKRLLLEELMKQTASTPTLPPPQQLRQRSSVDQIIGIANPTGRQFTDQAIDDLRYEALREKYKLPEPP